MTTQNLAWLVPAVPLAPLLGALLSGLFCRVMPKRAAHTICIAGVATALLASVLLFLDVRAGGRFNFNAYTWFESGSDVFGIGFLIDPLSSVMMLVVCFVSLMVHLYTIGYMRDDPGYNRFFSYIALFTFAMLMLVMSNNFLQLFFGWEAVGLISYLLIGFWHDRPSATAASLKAFMVNRVGDMGFLLGIGLVFWCFGTLDYAGVFSLAEEAGDTLALPVGSGEVSMMTIVCILLFIGAMGKSAQMPFHVWLPESMEGPTPISALIHAATMVTAGIFMVARFSPLFELSETALSFIMIVGALTALFMGLLGVVQTDIKRVIAYSTLSQLGYMTAALGASAYTAAIFHLTTHAFFKALLFLAAGSVIIGLHHKQDIREMGALRRGMPVTHFAALIGSLALSGIPFFSGFYSKDAIIEAVRASDLPGAGFAWASLLVGVFVTALYTFRLYFLVFCGRARFAPENAKPHESPKSMTIPLILLALPSAGAGFFLIEPMLFGGFFRQSIVVLDAHSVVETLRAHFDSPLGMALRSAASPVFWLTLLGVLTAWFLYLQRPALPAAIRARGGFLLKLLVNRYYIDALYEKGLCGAARLIGKGLWAFGDGALIDGFFVGGPIRAAHRLSEGLRAFQSGHVARYAFAMALAVCVMLSAYLLTLFLSPGSLS